MVSTVKRVFTQEYREQAVKLVLELGKGQAFLGEAAALQGVDSPRYASSDVNETVIPSGPLNQSLGGAFSNAPRIVVDSQNNISFVEPSSNGSVTVTVDREGQLVSTTTIQTFDDQTRLEVTTYASGPQAGMVITRAFNAQGELAGTITDTPDGSGGMNRVVEMTVAGRAVVVNQHASAEALANEDGGGDDDNDADNAVNNPLRYGIDAHEGDYETLGIKIDGQTCANQDIIADQIDDNWANAEQLITYGQNIAGGGNAYVGDLSNNNNPSTNPTTPATPNTLSSQIGYGVNNGASLVQTVNAGDPNVTDGQISNQSLINGTGTGTGTNSTTYENFDAFIKSQDGQNALGSLNGMLGLMRALQSGNPSSIFLSSFNLASVVSGNQSLGIANSAKTHSQNNSCLRTFCGRKTLKRHLKTAQNSCSKHYKTAKTASKDEKKL